MVRAHYKSYERGPHVLISKSKHNVVISKSGSCVHNLSKGSPTL